MSDFSRMFVLFAVPQSEYLYSVRMSRLQPFSPTVELAIQAAVLYDWLKRYGYDWNARSVCDREDVVLRHVSEERIADLRFTSEPFWEGLGRNVQINPLNTATPLILPEGTERILP